MMSKAKYIPIVIKHKNVDSAVRIGTATIQNHALVLSVVDANLRATLWGEVEDDKINQVEIKFSDSGEPIIHIHTKESGNKNV